MSKSVFGVEHGEGGEVAGQSEPRIFAWAATKRDYFCDTISAHQNQRVALDEQWEQ